MQKGILERWSSEFRQAAKADNLKLFRDHLRRLGLPDAPELLLHGTILAVHACCSYASLDHQSPVRFLQLQKYSPVDAPGAKYAFTFDLWGKGYARVLVSAKMELLDLADLYGFPWPEYEMCGFPCFWVSRADGEGLSGHELTQIQKQITNDLRFDYSDDELGFWFDDNAIEGILQVTLQDIDGCLNEDEEEK